MSRTDKDRDRRVDFWNDPPPRWYVHYIFHGPQRRMAGEYGRASIAEYRATGDVETVEPESRGRNCAKWFYW